MRGLQPSLIGENISVMQGLRTPENDKFLRFFSIVQNFAEFQECVFFLDAGDGRGFETEDLEGEDLMGWLIPQNKLEDFEKEWESNTISDDWSDFFVWAIWKNSDNPVITFKA